GLQSLRVAFQRAARSMTQPRHMAPLRARLVSPRFSSAVQSCWPYRAPQRSRTWKKMSLPPKSGYRMKSSPPLIAKGGPNSAELEARLTLMARSRKRLDAASTLNACQSTRYPTKLEGLASSPTRRDRTNRHGFGRLLAERVTARRGGIAEFVS